MNDLLLFWTSNPGLPNDKYKKLTVKFLKSHSLKVLPEADTCPMILLLPTVHQSYEKFREYMDKGIELAKYGFGKI